MTKKMLNQNAKYDQRFLDKVEPKFEFSNKPINRLKVVKENSIQNKTAKEERILNLKKKINSIQDCNLKDNSKNLVMGDGDINSPIMLIGEAPNEKEDLEAKTFCGDIGVLLNKMLLAINIKGLFMSPSPKTKFLELFLKLQSSIELIFFFSLNILSSFPVLF